MKQSKIIDIIMSGCYKDEIKQYIDEISQDVAEKQRSACVRHYYDSDNKHGTLATIAETPLVTESKQEQL